MSGEGLPQYSSHSTIKTFSGINNPILVPFVNMVWDDFIIALSILGIFVLGALLLMLFGVHPIIVSAVAGVGFLLFVAIQQLCGRIYRMFDTIPHDGIIYDGFSYLMSRKHYPARYYGDSHNRLYIFSGKIPWRIIVNPDNYRLPLG